MCGRFVHSVPFGVIAEWLEGSFEQITADLYTPRWNISPTATVLGMRMEDGQRLISNYRWGMVPPWASEIASKFPTHNARVESLASRPTFRGAYRMGRRVLVPADGYYEWQVLNPGETNLDKQPWYMSDANGEPQMALAGLYDWWRRPGSDSSEPWLASCTVITSEPGADVADIHDRQPIVLPRDQWDVWLDPDTSTDEARSLLVPSPAGTFARRKVAAAVGNSRNEGAYLIDELADF